MQPNTTLRLGDFTFADMEIPDKITIGGKQAIVTHDLVGGVRVIDAMGAFDDPLQWSGWFRGQNALSRAQYLNSLRRAGAPLTLSWADLSYQVTIESFQADFERAYMLPYRISCAVVADVTASAAGGPVSNVDDLVRGDMNTANTLSGTVGNAPLSGFMGTLNSAVSSVSNFAHAAQSTINGVLAPLAAAQTQVKTLISSVGNTISNIATVGGVLPNNPIAQQVFKLNGQIASMTSLPALYSLQSVLGRMGTNLHSIGAGTKTVTMAGGNLYALAAREYGDATAWPILARANGTTDPQITGVKTIIIPPPPPADQAVGGVLNA